MTRRKQPYGSRTSPQENDEVPIYKLPPPFEIPPLPSESDSRNFPIEKYWSATQDEDYPFDEVDQNDDILKKVVINEIRKCPAIWQTNSVRAAQENFPKVAVSTFKRTGILLSVKSIRNIYKGAKDSLRNRMRIGIVGRRMNPHELEHHLWTTWELYPFIRFYREFLPDWEAQLQNEIEEEDKGPDCKKFKYSTLGMPPQPREGAWAPENDQDGIVVEYAEDDDVLWEDPPLVKPSAPVPDPNPAPLPTGRRSSSLAAPSASTSASTSASPKAPEPDHASSPSQGSSGVAAQSSAAPSGSASSSASGRVGSSAESAAALAQAQAKAQAQEQAARQELATKHAMAQAAAQAQAQEQARYAHARASAQHFAHVQAQAHAHAQAEAEARAQAMMRSAESAAARSLEQTIIQAQARAQAQVHTAQYQAQEKAKAEGRALAKVEAQAQAEARARAQAHAQAQAEAHARAQIQSEARAQAHAQAQAEAQARAQFQAQAQARAQGQTQSAIRPPGPDGRVPAGPPHSQIDPRSPQFPPGMSQEQINYIISQRQAAERQIPPNQLQAMQNQWHRMAPPGHPGHPGMSHPMQHPDMARLPNGHPMMMHQMQMAQLHPSQRIPSQFPNNFVPPGHPMHPGPNQPIHPDMRRQMQNSSQNNENPVPTNTNLNDKRPKVEVNQPVQDPQLTSSRSGQNSNGSSVNQSPQVSNSQVGTSAGPSAPNGSTFSKDMSQISYQAERLANERPECIPLLRKSLFQVILALDEKKFTSSEELFTSLAKKSM